MPSNDKRQRVTAICRHGLEGQHRRHGVVYGTLARVNRVLSAAGCQLNPVKCGNMSRAECARRLTVHLRSPASDNRQHGMSLGITDPEVIDPEIMGCLP